MTRPSVLRIVEEVTLATRSIRGARAARLIVLSLLLWIAEAGVYLLASDALGTGLSAPEALAVMVFANAAALIPAGPGYLGTFDAAVILAVRATGASHSDARRLPAAPAVPAVHPDHRRGARDLHVEVLRMAAPAPPGRGPDRAVGGMKPHTATSPATAGCACDAARSLRALAGTPVAIAAGTLIVLLGLSALLRTGGLSGPFWIDEGLSVGIASHIADRHSRACCARTGRRRSTTCCCTTGWTRSAPSEAATHALSLLFALLTVPAALWAGWSLFGRRAGLVGGDARGGQPGARAPTRRRRACTRCSPCWG